ncbi:MAG TPA: serine hydrolase domain-containing protein [Armatimonadaceae bacterium]|nr:serine hydrolase domain-containing protein [Armatimonadaceae bacterium]
MRSRPIVLLLALAACHGGAAWAAQSAPGRVRTDKERTAASAAVAADDGKRPPAADAPRVSPQRKRWEEEVNLLTTPYLLALYQSDYPALRATADKSLADMRRASAAASDGGVPAARCLAYLMRAEACRVLRDPAGFAISAAGYRREAANLPAGHPLRGREPGLKSYHAPGVGVRSGFVLPPEKLAARGIDPGALDRLVTKAGATHSDALVVMKDGEIVAEKYFGSYQSPIALMSVTKPFLALAVGALLDEGKIKTLDQPVADFFPEWRGMPRHARITVRHLLTHTSGLKAEVSGEEEGADPLAQMRRTQAMNRDLVRYALARPVEDEPGAAYQYSDDALHLLSGVVQRASGMPADRYVGRKFFTPLGVKEYSWARDEAGHARGADGLSMRAHDLAKFGQLLLDRGRWRGNRLVSEGFVAEMLRNQFHGPDAPLAPTLGDAETPALGLIWWLREDAGRLISFEHSGSHGQYLIVYPESRMVVARQARRVRFGNVSGATAAPETEFSAISDLSRALASASRP